VVQEHVQVLESSVPPFWHDSPQVAQVLPDQEPWQRQAQSASNSPLAHAVADEHEVGTAGAM